MIKFLIVAAALLGAALIFGPSLSDTQGFVHITAGGYIVETSLTVSILLLVVLFIVVYAVVRIISRCVHIPKGTTSWFRRHGEKTALNRQDAAFVAYEEGSFAKALNLIQRTGPVENLPANSLFAAAKASFYLGKYDITRKCLEEAGKRGAAFSAAAGVTRAKLNLYRGSTEKALKNLSELGANSKNKLTYELYYRCYSQENNLEKLCELSPVLVKYQIINEEEGRSLRLKYLEQRLQNAHNAADLHDLWKKIPKADRSDPKIMGPFVNSLITAGDVSKARSISLDLLKKGQDPDFLDCISTWEICIPDVLELLKKQSQDNLASQVNLPLLKALGNLELKAGQAADAVENYKKALEFSNTPDILAKIGDGLAAQQRFDKSAEYYNKAFAMAERAHALTITDRSRKTSSSTVPASPAALPPAKN